jgi:hypothetical protein
MALSHEIIEHAGKGARNIMEDYKEDMTKYTSVYGTDPTSIQDGFDHSSLGGFVHCVQAHPVIAGAALGILAGIALYDYLTDE